jgi:hypothetical protein
VEVVRAGDGLKAGGRERRIVDRGLGVGFEVPDEPASRDARIPPRVLGSNQDCELEQIAERRPAELAQRRLSDQEDAALDRSMEDRSRYLGPSTSAFLGPDGAQSLPR